MLSHTLTALSLLAVTSAHFQLNFPKARGFSEDSESTFPCGGFNNVQQQRTNFPISGGPIQVNFEHAQTNIAVYMAIGDSPGSSFNIVAKQQLMVQGLGGFCLGSVSVPAGMNVSEGTTATIQVVTNNEDGGGLYQVSQGFIDAIKAFDVFATNIYIVCGCHIGQQPTVSNRLQQ